jgi:serine protease Do
MNYNYGGYGGENRDGEPETEERAVPVQAEAEASAEIQRPEELPGTEERFGGGAPPERSFWAPPGIPDAPARVPDTPARDESERAEASAPERDWREAEYREYSVARESAYSPGIPNGSLYAPPRRTRNEAPKPARAERQRRGGGFLRAVCLVLVCAVIGAASGIGAAWYGLSTGVVKLPRAEVVLGRPNADITPSSQLSEDENQSTEPSSVSVPGGMLTGKEIYRLASNQVVSLSTEVPSQGFGFGFESQSNTVYGSGFVISEDGYILTNYHVVQYASDYGYELTVGMRDGTTYSAAVVGGEADSDVAVIKVDASLLSPVTIGSSAAMQVGENIYAVGNPRRLDHTMTDGIISALDREVQVENNVSIAMFQISAAVNSGNSGGPVYNERGEVIGIVSAKYASAGTEGLGFAIPIDDAMSIAKDLIEHGHVTGKVYLGVSVTSVDQDDAERYNAVVGAYVTYVEPGSCAEKAGIKQGDIITRLGKNPVTSVDDLMIAKRDFKAGETAVVEVFRGGGTVRLDITFDEAAAETN